jgi:HPt (histidine-containing phosphotransfer) domain-containing protein
MRFRARLTRPEAASKKRCDGGPPDSRERGAGPQARTSLSDTLVMPSPPEHRGAPPLDPTARAMNPDLDRASLIARFEGDADLLDEVSAVFIADCPRMLANLRDARARRNFAALRQAAHALKGAVSNFTDGPARESALMTELLARSGDDNAWATADALDDLVRELTVALGGATSPDRPPAS